MVTSRELTTKDKILDVIHRMPEGGTIDDAIYRLNVIKAVAQGLKDFEEGRVRDHEEVFDDLLNEDAKNSNRVEQLGNRGSGGNKKTHRRRRAKRGQGLRQKIKEGH